MSKLTVWLILFTAWSAYIAGKLFTAGELAKGVLVSALFVFYIIVFQIERLKRKKVKK